MNVLLDTNAYSGLKRGTDAVVNIVRRSEEIFLSTIVAGELLYGFRCGSRYERNLAELHEFLSRPRVQLLQVTLNTADRYSRIAEQLRRKGRPIPVNDIWIAAHAMECGADLVSADPHFGEIDGLVWRKSNI